MKLKELTNEEFNDFVQEFNVSSIYQSTEYALVMNNQNYDSILLGLVNGDNEIIAGTLVLIDRTKKYKIAYAPRGFLIDYNNFELLKLFVKLIKSFLGKNNIMSLKINPPIYKSIYYIKDDSINKNNYYDHIFNSLHKLGFKHMGYNDYFEGIRPRFEAVVDLAIDKDVRFNNLKRELKTRIRASIKDGLKVIKGNEEDLNIIYNQVKRKYPRNFKYFEDCYRFFSMSDSIDIYYTKIDTVKYLKETTKKLEELEFESGKINSQITTSKNMSKTINRKMKIDQDVYKYKNQLVKATKMLQDYPDGIITSTALVAKQKDEVTLLIDGHETNYKNLNSKHLLIWQLCNLYSKEGFKKFNLGGIANINIDNNKFKGLNDFKLSFNPYVIEYMGDLEIITNNTLYFMYSNSNSIKKIIKK